MSNRERRLWLTAFLLVVGLCAATVAVAIPDANGVITTCYVDGATNGPLRPVDKPSECDAGQGEVALSFNQQGSAGPEGPRGATGAAGPQGPAGPASLGPGGLELRYWAEVGFDARNRLEAKAASSGVAFRYQEHYGISRFVFDRPVRDCIPLVTRLHRKGRASAAIDEDYGPFHGNDDSLPPGELAVDQLDDPRELLVTGRWPSDIATQPAFRFTAAIRVDRINAIYPVPFSLVVLCHPEAVAPPEAPVALAPPPRTPFRLTPGQLPQRSVLRSSAQPGKPSKAAVRLLR